MKKLMALFLAATMLLTCCAFMASAEEGYDLQGMTVKIRLWDAVNPYAEDVADVDKETWLPIYDGIKAKYNCNFEFYTTTTEWDEMPNEWAMAVASGQPSWHITNNLSSMWIMRMVANNSLTDISAGLETLNMPQLFKDAGMVADGRYGYITDFPGTEGLVFNRKMIEDAGMEYDPGEMFAMGKWSYDDFYAYVTELQAKLPEGTYSYFNYPNYWQIFAAPANNCFAITPAFEMTFLSDPYIETIEFLQKVCNAGVVRLPNVSDDGSFDYWGTSGATFDVGVEVAMTHRATWQMGGLNSNGLDWGFVPYPWGSQVTLGTEGDYTTLSDNYMGTYYDLGVTGAILAGVENDFPGLDKDYVIKALVNLSYDLWFTEERHEAIAAMAAPDYVLEPTMDPFMDELSAELYSWLRTRSVLNPIVNFGNAGLATSNGGETSFPTLITNIIEQNLPVRATLEAALPEIEATFRDAGFIK